MDWRDFILGIGGTAFLAIAAYSLKVLIELKNEMAGWNEWRKGVDKWRDEHDDACRLPSNPTLRPSRN